jgi:hypothetical protein
MLEFSVMDSKGNDGLNPEGVASLGELSPV